MLNHEHVCRQCGANSECVCEVGPKVDDLCDTCSVCERISVCCGAAEHPDVENFCSACRDGTGFECIREEKHSCTLT